jgi:predicted nucleic acid-binding protein
MKPGRSSGRRGMTVKVVDASAIGALLFGEPEAEAMAARLAGTTLTAPALLPFEVTNIALKKIRRHPDLRAPLLAAFALFERVAVDLVLVDHQAVLQLADITGLTAYDASYLWLARTLDTDLITLDAALETAHAAAK